MKRILATAFGAVLVMFGISLFSVTNTYAHTPSETSSEKCLTNGWQATFVVHNDPDRSYGSAKISGTGTSLDGAVLQPAGDSQPLVITEPSSVSSVS